jgi:hypothetical protein
MAKLVVMGAMCKCSMGTGPCSLILTPENKVTASMVPAGTIMDQKIANLPSFIMCTTQSNPAVAAATSAAMGTPTPAPCVPVIAAPWAPGSSKVMLNNKPALLDSDTCNCSYGGTITISDPGQTKIDAS